MRFTKPAWVIHKDSAGKDDQTAKRQSIFSVHVHPDGSRIATGGLDSKIRIWSTKPILNLASELSNRPPKSLCTLTMHTGPVLAVRWAHSGRWLASGSDDQIVMVWDLDPTARGKVWGSDEVNVEGWKPLKRLPGHESDVTDVAWSPGDRYLASVGLDSQVMIWCGLTLERLRKLDQHQGFVKGVCWDPVGEFLATCSDDRTVKIWRTTDWELEAEVSKPFEDSPGSTFFRRLSWSPDGAHITASNATNNKGFVFIAAVITRNTWTSEISLVGHENTVEVAAYNPHIFLRNSSIPATTSNICSVVALGADDRSVSVWQTKSARPLIVAREVFERQIMDLSWSWDGLTLYAASSDGTLGVFNFDPEELEGIAPHSVQEQYFQKFAFTLPPLPEGYANIVAPYQETPTVSSRITPPPSPTRAPSVNPAPSQTGFGAGANGVNGGREVINQLVAKRGKKAKSSFANTSSASIPSAFANQSASAFAPSAKSTGLPPASRSFDAGPSRTQHQTAPPSLNRQNSHSVPPPADNWPHTVYDADVDMDMEVPIDSLSTVSTLGKGKRKGAGFEDDSRPAKARTLGGDRPREAVVVRELGGVSAVGGRAPNAWGDPHLANALPVAQLLSALAVKVEGSDDMLEAKNSEGDDPTEVALVSGKHTQWLDFLPSRVLAMTGTASFAAVALEDGSLVVYSPNGRRLMPTLTLGSPAYAVDSSNHSLMVVTASGQLYSWNTKTQTSNFPPISLITLLSSSPNCTILSATVRPNGTPVIQCSTGAAHSYDPTLFSWVKLSERWWAEGSDVWQSRQRGGANAARGVVAGIEGVIAASTEDGGADKPRPSWWSSAMTLGHLETKLHAARVLDSPPEYKQALLVYAKKIADEGFRGKAEELIKELFGPVYWRPGREEGWQSSIMGLSKRDLAKDVLSVFARSKTLAKMAMDWQETLKKASNGDY
ncbi:histone transcription regulator 1 [Athelia psychrophila]|uniref:Protein HIR n=1 Tax=Athelia psychrophila TaxID=1759441 RepID=A0A166P454_9AGAM|nr:histone transcription regulator 1 [Fibularhizoctonia sp. CBS 109695]